MTDIARNDRQDSTPQTASNNRLALSHRMSSITATSMAALAIISVAWVASVRAEPNSTIVIQQLDPRTVTDASWEITFKTQGESHYDYEHTPKLSGNEVRMRLDARGGSADPTTGVWVGDFLKTTEVLAGSSDPSRVVIHRTDPRPFSEVCMDVTFVVDGQSHHDYQCFGLPPTTITMILDARGGTFEPEQQRWVGDFLRLAGS